jgi:hypothetical protein
MHRRTFIKQTGAAALAVTATATSSSGPFVRAGDKGGDKTPIVGKGEYRHLDIRRDVLLVPDLHARVIPLDKDNRVSNSCNSALGSRQPPRGVVL